MSKGRQMDAEMLEALSQALDGKAQGGIKLAAELLRVRDRQGRMRPLVANAAQVRFEAQRRKHNVVLKARQMGMTTWVAGRFFLRTICKPGTTTLLVAHTREASEMMFATVRRMWMELPEDVQRGCLRLSACNAGQMVFAETGSEFRVASASDANAGRGLSVQNLHCSEVSRWPGNARETLAGLRAALAPGGEMVLESTPNGAYGAFYEEWCAASEAPAEGREKGAEDQARAVRHFLPWWMEPAYSGAFVAQGEMTAEELHLQQRHGLSGQQVGFRRDLERRYGFLRTQEFAEEPESCFRATGACCFEVDALDRRLHEVGEPTARMRNGALLEWFRPLLGRRYVLGVDTAGGGEDGDFAALQVVDVDTGMQCAELQERLRPRELAEVCVQVAAAYGGALVAVERNNHGAAFWHCWRRSWVPGCTGKGDRLDG